jgi:hypothetical protein
VYCNQYNKLYVLLLLLLLQVGCQRNGGWYQDYSLVGGHHRWGDSTALQV